MSARVRWAVEEQIILNCTARTCAAQWVSEPYRVGRFEDGWTRGRLDPMTSVMRAAAKVGWRVFIGRRGREYVYCPVHEPTSDLRLVQYGEEPTDG